MLFLLEATTLLLFAVGVGISVLAGVLLKPKIKNPVSDEKPTTLATRGSYVAYVVGRRKVGPVVAWAGIRTNQREGGGKGKGLGGGGTQGEKVYYEQAWHLLCVGPAARLWSITQSGKKIFTGPIDAESHPSGTAVSLGREGTFKVYWGEPDQPVNTFLGAATRVGITSQWPFMCYVQWGIGSSDGKRLGPAPMWPLIEYEIEVRPTGSQLYGSAPWIDAIGTLGGATYAITAVLDGTPGVGYIDVAGRLTNVFKPGVMLRIAGNNMTDRDLTVLRSAYSSGGFLDGMALLTAGTTRTYFREPLLGLTVAGTLQAYSESSDQGANPAHVISHLLHGSTPFGLGLDESEFDHDSLEEVGALLEVERVPCSVVGIDGDEAIGILAALMQDMGLMISWDVQLGKFRLRAIRAVDPLLIPTIGDDLLLSPLPEIVTGHDDRPADNLIFLFSSRARNFRDDSVNVDDDGQSEFRGRRASRRVGLPTVTDITTASRVADRRALEELAGGATYKVTAARQARFLQPGGVVIVAGVADLLRIVEVSLDVLTGKVVLDCIADTFGIVQSTYVTAPGAAVPADAGVEPDAAVKIVEVPSYLSPGVQTVVVPRVRANQRVVASTIWLGREPVGSPPGTPPTTYSAVGVEDAVQTGGTLVTPMILDGPMYLAQGPEVLLLGADASAFQDLTGDEVSWRAGRQVVAIEDELLFVQKFTALGGSSYRMDGVLRARYDTAPDAHSFGMLAIVMNLRAILTIRDLLLEPGVTLYAKSQPRTGESIPLEEVDAISKVLYGKGVVPMPVENLRVNAGRQTWAAGSNIIFRWNYRSTRSARTGAGMQGYGRAVSFSPPEGELVLEIRANDLTLKRVVSGLTGFTYTYTNANLVADFGSEPTIFRARLYGSNGGRKGTSREVQLVRY